MQDAKELIMDLMVHPPTNNGVYVTLGIIVALAILSLVVHFMPSGEVEPPEYSDEVGATVTGLAKLHKEER